MTEKKKDERKQAEERRRHDKDLLDLFDDAAPDGVYAVPGDLNGPIYNLRAINQWREENNWLRNKEIPEEVLERFRLD
ncbi:hypothetical protein [Effusibacillus lacus]|uniref:Uncharacterized protein n=1 Tax=Effusibacillus lacus TaxID=1348429 RepID=A0A292YDB9_9BACL|nr:hypothetical protein [Effusibacillus lacus]GAX89992.1 hypothetical protein EFBL_1618 [Effusibacillus lacus]